LHSSRRVFGFAAVRGRVASAAGVYVAAAGVPGGRVLGPLPHLVTVMLSSLRRGPRMKAISNL
jgi:hypothetical protein